MGDTTETVEGHVIDIACVRNTFSAEYASVPVHQKVRENTVLTVGVVLVMAFLLIGGVALII